MAYDRAYIQTRYRARWRVARKPSALAAAGNRRAVPARLVAMASKRILLRTHSDMLSALDGGRITYLPPLGG
jgi:hypothetical protein